MNETSSSSQPEPSQPGSNGSAVGGALHRQLQEVFPDLDSDRVAEVLGLVDHDTNSKADGAEVEK